MANYCAISGTITLMDEATAARLTKILTDETAANEGNLDFGGGVWMLGLHVAHHKKEVSFFGDVKWALEQSDMEQFVKWLGKYEPVKDMEIVLNYEEMGCDVIGKYLLRKGILEDYFIPEDKFPKYPEIQDGDDEDEIHDAYMDQLYAMIESIEPALIHDFNEEAA